MKLASKNYKLPKVINLQFSKAAKQLPGKTFCQLSTPIGCLASSRKFHLKNSNPTYLFSKEP